MIVIRRILAGLAILISLSGGGCLATLDSEEEKECDEYGGPCIIMEQSGEPDSAVF